MELKEFKRLCYNAKVASDFALSNEKTIKIDFIKECFFMNLNKMEVYENGCTICDMSKRYVKIGTEKLSLTSLGYNPFAKRENSLSGISAICKNENATIYDIAIENLSLEDINNIFVNLTIIFDI